MGKPNILRGKGKSNVTLFTKINEGWWATSRCAGGHDVDVISRFERACGDDRITLVMCLHSAVGGDLHAPRGMCECMLDGSVVCPWGSGDVSPSH